MMLTHGDTAVVRRERMRGHFMGDDVKPGKFRTLERVVVARNSYSLRSSPRKRGPRSRIVSSPFWIPASAGMNGRGWLLERDRVRWPPQEGGGEGVAVPAQIRRQPLENPEAALAALPLDPRHRHLRDPPAEAMGLHQELDAVAETLGRLDRNPFDHPAREHAKAVAGVGGGKPRHVVQGEV